MAKEMGLVNEVRAARPAAAKGMGDCRDDYAEAPYHPAFDQCGAATAVEAAAGGGSGVPYRA